MFSDGRYTWDPLIFDRHFESTFDVGILSNSYHIHSAHAQSQVEGELLNRNSSASSVVPSKIYAKHILNPFGDSAIDNGPSDYGGPINLINPWESND